MMDKLINLASHHSIVKPFCPFTVGSIRGRGVRMINRSSHSPELITQDLVSLISDYLTGVSNITK